MAKAGVRFEWNENLERDMRAAIEIILDPITGCLRAPIPVQKTLLFYSAIPLDIRWEVYCLSFNLWGKGRLGRKG